MTSLRNALMVAVTWLLVVATGCAPTQPSVDMHRIVTITFVRHGESEGNASGSIDTSVPGPDLTYLGESQALMAANQLRATNCDGIFASTMIRTQETAQPLSQQSRKPVVVLAGLREIEAGQAEGRREGAAASVYYKAIMAWVAGHRDQRIPGSIDGNEFDTRFDDAIDSIYKSGDSHPVVFSHGAAIAAWTVMHAKKASIKMMTSNPLPNTGLIVITGNPQHGWTLDQWNLTKVS
jgi:broad specificity phosphatase PhoE